MQRLSQCRGQCTASEKAARKTHMLGECPLFLQGKEGAAQVADPEDRKTSNLHTQRTLPHNIGVLPWTAFPRQAQLGWLQEWQTPCPFTVCLRGILQRSRVMVRASALGKQTPVDSTTNSVQRSVQPEYLLILCEPVWKVRITTELT